MKVEISLVILSAWTSLRGVSVVTVLLEYSEGRRKGQTVNWKWAVSLYEFGLAPKGRILYLLNTLQMRTT